MNANSPLPLEMEICPACKGAGVEHHEADVGVGVIQGPAFCNYCGWSEPQVDYEIIEGDDDVDF